MLHEKEINIKDFEEKLYREVCRAGAALYAEILKKWDDEIHRTRDRGVYRDKGFRRSVLKTLMGEVEYTRRVYAFTDETGKKGTVYLLDEAIGKTGSGFFSEALAERTASAVCEMPYRKAAEAVSALTGQSISHTAAWNTAQRLGVRIDEEETENAEKALKNRGKGKKETKVLFEEQDGIWLHLQGKDRRIYGKGREMKLAVVYDGTEKKGENRFRLTNKAACANFETVKKFHRRKEGVIAAEYNTDEIELRVLNGDGASWIKHKMSEDTVYQLDRFHRNRALLSAVRDPEHRKKLFGLLAEGDTENFLVGIDTLAGAASDEKQEEALNELYTYFSSNEEGLTSWQSRAEIPEPPEGKEYRGAGAIESNVFSIIGNRMKGRRKCWSIRGGNNLARLLCLKSTGRLSGAVSGFAKDMPEKYEEEEITTLSAAKVRETAGKGFDGFKSYIIPSSQGWLKDFVKIRSFQHMRI